MRVDLFGLSFETPAVTFYLWSPWRASALEHKLLESLKAVPGDRYDVSISSDGSTYTLTATAKGSQLSDKCGDYTLSNTGLRGAKGVTTGAIVTECWSK